MILRADLRELSRIRLNVCARNSTPQIVATIAELDVLDYEGKAISHQNWTIAYVSSEELTKENGSAENAIDGQTFNYWCSDWSKQKSEYPHYLVIDLGKTENISGFRYIPKSGNDNSGRIKDYEIFVGDSMVK